MYQSGRSGFRYLKSYKCNRTQKSLKLKFLISLEGSLKYDTNVFNIPFVIGFLNIEPLCGVCEFSIFQLYVSLVSLLYCWTRDQNPIAITCLNKVSNIKFIASKIQQGAWHSSYRFWSIYSSFTFMLQIYRIQKVLCWIDTWWLWRTLELEINVMCFVTWSVILLEEAMRRCADCCHTGTRMVFRLGSIGIDWALKFAIKIPPLTPAWMQSIMNLCCINCILEQKWTFMRPGDIFFNLLLSSNDVAEPTVTSESCSSVT